MAQLKSTNILGNLAVTGDIVASSIKIPGGLATEFLTAAGTRVNNVATGSSLTADKILLGDGNSAIKASSIGIVNTIGADNTTIPTSSAIKTYVTGLGYASQTWVNNKGYLTSTSAASTYLPLAGGVVTGETTFKEDLNLGTEGQSINIDLLCDTLVNGDVEFETGSICVKTGKIQVGQNASFSFETDTFSIQMRYNSSLDAIEFVF